jgi:hypothetical protein
MPYQDPDPTDPMTLHGVEIETESDEAMVDMAACFIEEYARLGFDSDRILRMFHTQGYAGPAMALRVLGEERIRELVVQEMALRGPRFSKKNRCTATSTGISLPVLESGC